MASLLAIYGDRGSEPKLQKGVFFMISIAVISVLKLNKLKFKKFALLP